MLLIMKEKEKPVIKLAKEGKTTRDIAKEIIYPWRISAKSSIK